MATYSGDHDTPPPAAGHSGAGHGPPSAAGHLESYGVRVMLQAASREFEPEKLLKALLENVAGASLASGASVIGHLKCLLEMPGQIVVCNLTSLREGARCTVSSGPGVAPGAAPPRVVLKPEQEARLDLAVLVYGLPAATIDGLVRAALSEFLGSLAASWSVLAGEPGREVL